MNKSDRVASCSGGKTHGMKRQQTSALTTVHGGTTQNTQRHVTFCANAAPTKGPTALPVATAPAM